MDNYSSAVDQAIGALLNVYGDKAVIDRLETLSEWLYRNEHMIDFENDKPGITIKGSKNNG